VLVSGPEVGRDRGGAINWVAILPEFINGKSH
jgi:hypothetical protein